MKTIWISTLIIMFCTLAFSAEAAQFRRIVPVEKEDELIDMVLDYFWGHAVDSKGNIIEAEDDDERSTLPVPRETARYALNVGFRTGMGQWCGLNWNERFNAFMKRMGYEVYGEKATAFVAMMHGTGQKFTYSRLQKKGACPAEKRAIMQKGFANEMKTFTQQRNVFGR